MFSSRRPNDSDLSSSSLYVPVSTIAPYHIHQFKRTHVLLSSTYILHHDDLRRILQELDLMRHQNTDLLAQISLDAPTNIDSSPSPPSLGRLPFEQMLRYLHVHGRQWIVQQIDVRVPIQRSSHVHARLLTLMYVIDQWTKRNITPLYSHQKASRLDHRPACSRRSLAVESPRQYTTSHTHHMAEKSPTAPRSAASITRRNSCGS